MTKPKVIKKVKESEFQIKKVIPKLRAIPHLKVFCIKNELTVGTVQEAVKNKAMGQENGISDLLVMDLQTQTIDFVELKRYDELEDGTYKNKGNWLDEQQAFCAMVEFLGGQNELCKYYLIHNPDELNEYIKEKKREL